MLVKVKLKSLSRVQLFATWPSGGMWPSLWCAREVLENMASIVGTFLSCVGKNWAQVSSRPF